MKIRTACELPNVAEAGGYRRWVERLLIQRWGPGSDLVPWSATRGEVRAYVLRSNWVADCPCCNSASVIDPYEPFFCPDCVMAGNNHQPAVIRMPAARAAIEELLIRRPDPMTRNWLPHETLDELRAENLAHGIEEETR